MVQALLSSVSEPVLVLDATLHVQQANNAFCKVFDIDLAAALGRIVYELPGDLWKCPETRSFWQAVASPEFASTQMEIEERGPDGSPRVMRFIANRLDVGESSNRATTVTILNISEHSRVTNDLHACEERYHTLVDAAQDGIWTIDSKGITSFASGRMAAMLGTTPEQMVGKPSFAYVFEADLERAAELFQSKVAGSRDPFEFRLRRADGSWFWASVKGTAFHNTKGETTGLIGTFRDISDQKLAEETAERHADELARSTADLQHFAHVTSHDLREPLRIMRVYAQLLMRRYTGRLDPEADRFLKFIESGADRMDKLVHDLLTYSQATERDGSIANEVQLNRALEWAKKNLATPIAETAAEIRDANLPVVRGDEVQLVQLFQHLLSNAIKYRRPTERPRIQITAEQRDGEWIVAVSDNGVGIPEEKWNHVFGIFKRLHGPEIPGTGIGLAICRRISQNHGGKIWLQSEPGRGSTFFFSIPAVVQ